MRAAVVLVGAVLTLAACSSTVDGRPDTDGVPRTSATAAPSAPTPTPTSADATPNVVTDPPTIGTTTESSGPDPSPAALPPGFYAAGAALGYRPMTTDEFDCTTDQTSGCFGFMVFSAPGCPAGAAVTVGIFDKATDPDNPVGTATGTTPPIDPDGSQAVVIGDTTGIAANLTARVQQVVC